MTLCEPPKHEHSVSRHTHTKLGKSNHFWHDETYVVAKCRLDKLLRPSLDGGQREFFPIDARYLTYRFDREVAVAYGRQNLVFGVPEQDRHLVDAVPVARLKEDLPNTFVRGHACLLFCNHGSSTI